MSHPNPSAPADRRPIEPGDVLENPVTGEHAVVLELPWHNTEGRAVAELTALPGARVVGEHLHPALHERFSVLRGELTVVRDGGRSVLRAGESADIEPGVWHDWWNEGQEDAVVRVEITPGERFVHMIETLFGLAREGTSTPRECRTRCSWRSPRRSSRTSSCSAGRHDGAAPRVRRADADRQAARLPRHLPEPLAHNAGAAGRLRQDHAAPAARDC